MPEPCAICGFPRWRDAHAEWCERVRGWLESESPRTGCHVRHQPTPNPDVPAWVYSRMSDVQ